jgi:hypothetical protein
VLVAGATWVVVDRPDPAPAPVRLLDVDDVREADEGWDYDALSTGGDDPTEFVQLLSPRSALTRESTRPGLDLTFFGDRREHSGRAARGAGGGRAHARAARLRRGRPAGLAAP